jgi:hypothetical protein
VRAAAEEGAAEQRREIGVLFSIHSLVTRNGTGIRFKRVWSASVGRGTDVRSDVGLYRHTRLSPQRLLDPTVDGRTGTGTFLVGQH